MKVYQVDVKVYTLCNIELEYMLSKVTAFVDKTLSIDAAMLDFHEQKIYKPYVISGFKEFEKDKIYKEGKVYSFSLRTIDEALKDFFLKNLANTTTREFKGLSSCGKFIPQMQLERIYTVTPALLKLDEEGYWKNHLTVEEFERYVFDNTIKKYNYFTGESLNEDFQFYHQIVFLNQKPISTNYKKIHLLGDKIELTLAENETAQKLAYFLLGTGILNNGSRAYGFLNYRAV